MTSPTLRPSEGIFPFLRLPSELRLEIYSYVAPLALDFPGPYRSQIGVSDIDVIVPLLHVCSLIRAELMPVIHSQTVFNIPSSSTTRTAHSIDSRTHGWARTGGLYDLCLIQRVHLCVDDWPQHPRDWRFITYANYTGHFVGIEHWGTSVQQFAVTNRNARGTYVHRPGRSTMATGFHALLVKTMFVVFRDHAYRCLTRYPRMLVNDAEMTFHFAFTDVDASSRIDVVSSDDPRQNGTELTLSCLRDHDAGCESQWVYVAWEGRMIGTACEHISDESLAALGESLLSVVF